MSAAECRVAPALTICGARIRKTLGPRPATIDLLSSWCSLGSCSGIPFTAGVCKSGKPRRGRRCVVAGGRSRGATLLTGFQRASDQLRDRGITRRECAVAGRVGGSHERRTLFWRDPDRQVIGSTLTSQPLPFPQRSRAPWGASTSIGQVREPGTIGRMLLPAITAAARLNLGWPSVCNVWPRNQCVARQRAPQQACCR